MFLHELKNLITSNSKDITSLKLSEVLSLSLKNNITPLYTLKGHSDTVLCVCWSPGGEFVASGSEDGTARIWDAKKGTLVRTLKGHSDLVSSVSWSPDGKFVASGSSDKADRVWDAKKGTFKAVRIIIWDAKKGTVVHTLKGHSYGVRSVCWSPSGKFVASGSWDKTVRIWDAKKGTLVHTFKGYSDSVWSVSWSPDGKFVASGSVDGTVIIWDAKKGTLVHTLKGHSEDVFSVSWSPSGKFVASGSWDKTIRIWDAKKGTVVHTLKGYSYMVYSVCWSPDGKFVASVGMEDKTVRIWDAKKGTLVHTLKGHSKPVRSVSWSPGGEFIASGSWDKTVRIWRGGRNKKLNLHSIQQVLNALEMNTSVRALNLSNLQLHPNNISTLCNLLNVNKYITSVDLSNVNIEENGVLELAKCLVNNKSLLYLNLTNINLNYKGANDLYKGLKKNNTLIRLNLENNPISSKVKQQIDNRIQRNNLAGTNILETELNARRRRLPIPVVPKPLSIIPKQQIIGNSSIGIDSSYLIPASKLTFKKENKLGSGGFGTVYKGFWGRTKVAIKKLHIQAMTQKTMYEFKSEAKIMTKLHHPNTLPLFGVCVEPGNYAMVVPYMKRGSLFAYLHNNEPLLWKKRWKIALEIANGLLHLHSKNIFHRDLKSLNVLLDENMHARLCDFGISKVKQETRTTTSNKTAQAVGTVPWMAPELFKRRAKYTKACDVYSFGMVLWEIATRKGPWADAQNPSIIIQWVSSGEREDIPVDCPSIFKKIITDCWKEKTQRPSMEEVVKILHDNKQEALQF